MPILLVGEDRYTLSKVDKVKSWRAETKSSGTAVACENTPEVYLIAQKHFDRRRISLKKKVEVEFSSSRLDDGCKCSAPSWAIIGVAARASNALAQR